MIIVAKCVSIKLSYAAIRNIVCDSKEEKELLVNKRMASEGGRVKASRRESDRVKALRREKDDLTDN